MSTFSAASDAGWSAAAVARDLRPQTYGTARAERVRDPIVEPLWVGIRVLAAVDRGVVALLENGEPLTEHPEIDVAVADAVIAQAVVLDGFVIRASMYDRTGVDADPELATTTSTGFLKQSLLGRRRNIRAEAEERARFETAARAFEPDERAQFVAVDLLWVDGVSLVEVPLLERKRLLDSVLRESTVVRPGTYVRPPVSSWIGSWRGFGFSGVTYKAANGRYRPGGVKDDWIVTPMPRR